MLHGGSREIASTRIYPPPARRDGARPGTRLLRSAGQRKRRADPWTGEIAPVACTIDGCEKQARATGMCWMHYKRQQRHGDPGEA